VYTHDMCVVTMAQLGRGQMESGKYREPCVEDLKGSGEIEQCADWILSLWRETATPNDNPVPDPRLKVTCLKNRWGPAFGKTFLEFDGAGCNVWAEKGTEVISPFQRKAAAIERAKPDSSPGTDAGWKQLKDEDDD